MSWFSVSEYKHQYNVSSSTVRRQIQKGRIFAKKFGRNWYIQYPDAQAVSAAPRTESAVMAGEPILPGAAEGNLQSVINFSSKALHHYLLLSDKLMAEKELRIQEKEKELNERRQDVAELEEYVRMLEGEVQRLKDRPEGWR
ncbi:MAG: hypothetical protein V1798_10155 [Pseudomonadota bacterium]